MKEYKETRNSLLIKNTADISFYSAGSEECQPSYKYGPRIRPYHLIHFVINGKGKVRIDGFDFECQKNDIFIIPADSVSIYQADDVDPWTYCWVSFLGLTSEHLIDQITGSLPEIFIIRNKNCSSYYQLIEKILKIKDDSLSSFYMANSILLNILANLYKDINFDEKVIQELSLSDKIKFFIEMNYFRDLKISDIAYEFNIHPNYLTRIFKSHFNVTPKEYLMNLKFQKAQGLLSSTTLSIHEIAGSLGINDPLLFSRTFKKLIGISPSEYRKNNLNIDNSNN